MVTPILCYGSEIWGYQYIENIEKVHISFCKRYCLLPWNTSNAFVYGECGRLPLCITYMTRCIKFWLKVVRMDRSRYPLRCFLMLKGQNDIGRINWVTQIKSLLFRFGFGYVWIAQNVGNLNSFIQVFKQRIIITPRNGTSHYMIWVNLRYI